MTRIAESRPVTRETEASDRGRKLIVTLHARYIELRPKGTRQRYTMPYDAILWLAIKRKADEEWAEKKRRRDEQKKASRRSR